MTDEKQGQGGVELELEDGSAEVGRPLPTRRALVVDDDAISRRLLRDALDARGFEVVTASDGLEGIHVLLDVLLDLDVVVTDLAMPHMDGEQFIRTVRGAGGERDLHIFVVTGTPADADRLCALGADAVLTKQDGVDAVADAIDRGAGARPTEHPLRTFARASSHWTSRPRPGAPS